MTWNVSGIPKPEMRWKSPSEGYVTLVNPRFLLSERNLTIKTLEAKDAGIWSIEATNSLKTTKVQVEFGTIFGKRPATILDPALFSLNTRIPFDQRILWYILSTEIISLSFLLLIASLKICIEWSAGRFGPPETSKRNNYYLYTCAYMSRSVLLRVT